MLNTFIKNRGTTKTIIHDNNHNRISEMNWDADYDGDVANISIDTESNGRTKHFDIKLDNNNPYLHDLNIYNANKSPYQQIGNKSFFNSDFNVMLNNISTSLYSVSRKTLEISGSSQIIGSGSYPLLVTASLQDSYLSLHSYTAPRYDGVKIYSATYNKYTEGDKSFGKSAAIDKYVRKFGLFTQIVIYTAVINFASLTQ